MLLVKESARQCQCVLNVKSLIRFDKYVSLINFIITIRGIKPKQHCEFSNSLKVMAS